MTGSNHCHTVEQGILRVMCELCERVPPWVRFQRHVCVQHTDVQNVFPSLHLGTAYQIPHFLESMGRGGVGVGNNNYI